MLRCNPIARIVFNANDKATSLRIENQSDKLPYLAYSRMKMKREKSDALLVALPLFNVWNRKRHRRCGL